jgi:protein ImuB
MAASITGRSIPITNGFRKRKPGDMPRRYVFIWFRYLLTDWFTIRKPDLKDSPFVLCQPVHGRMLISAANNMAEQNDITIGIALADARAIVPSIVHENNIPGLNERLLKRLAEWCIRFTPFVAIDPPDGLILDASGCSHLWGGDEAYLSHIRQRLQERGYHVRTGMADTIGAAWAMAHYGKYPCIIESGQQANALLPLPAACLRLEKEVLERLQKLGLRQVYRFIHMPAPSLRRRFGASLLTRINQALGNIEEIVEPVLPVSVYQERLPCLEPISTPGGVQIALQQLLNSICSRLQKEQKGLRLACFKTFRIDGKQQEIRIGTHRASTSVAHLLKLFGDKIQTIEPGLGIELFVLDTPKVEQLRATQERIWESSKGLDSLELSELIDRLTGQFGTYAIRRYLPAEHYWPERSIRKVNTLDEKPLIPWKTDRPRPIQLLSHPLRIEVTAPIPDYPPMNFRYQGQLHIVKKADGPERIEQEWWIEDGQHRDYYIVEDQDGKRYWLFRSGHYSVERNHRWYLHGFFA